MKQTGLLHNFGNGDDLFELKAEMGGTARMDA